MSKTEPDNVENPFSYHRPDASAIESIDKVRKAAKHLWHVMLYEIPECAERTLAIRKLEETSMWANKAIAFRKPRVSNEPLDERCPDCEHFEPAVPHGTAKGKCSHPIADGCKHEFHMLKTAGISPAEVEAIPEIGPANLEPETQEPAPSPPPRKKKAQ